MLLGLHALREVCFFLIHTKVPVRLAGHLEHESTSENPFNGTPPALPPKKNEAVIFYLLTIKSRYYNRVKRQIMHTLGEDILNVYIQQKTHSRICKEFL